METYRSLKAKMKGLSNGPAPRNWSPALRPGRCDEEVDVPRLEQFGTGLPDMVVEFEGADPPPFNQTIFQSFEWYTPSWSTPVTISETVSASRADRVSTVEPVKLPSHYAVLQSLLPSLASLGITSMWLPPGCKATGPHDNGYGVYDLYDLGEFDCKGSRATKWGSKEELINLGKKAQQVGIGLLWDAVLNHRAGADDKEDARAVICHSKNRTITTSSPQNVTTWSVFTYPARNNLYSTEKYTWRHFSGIDWDDRTRSKSILRYLGDDRTSKPGWSDSVDTELGNYDYLMFADVDYSQPDVQSDILNWSTWLPTQIPGLTGFRLDAIKHYSATFQYKLLAHLRGNEQTKNWFFVGEYWRADSTFLAGHIDKFAGHMHMFDVKLVYNLSDFSAGRLTDLRNILKGCLVEVKPRHAITFVSNHDTQPAQSLAAPVLPWFVPHAYALILLRSSGIPCVFWGDVFGTNGPVPSLPYTIHGNRLSRLILLRTLYAYGHQHDHFARHDCIGWTREGHLSRSGGAGLAVLLNVSWCWKRMNMFVGREHQGEIWRDVMGWAWGDAQIDEHGYGSFWVPARGVAAWIDKDAVGRDKVESLVWPAVGKDSNSEETREVEVGK